MTQVFFEFGRRMGRAARERGAMMSKGEAAAIADAIHDIETGKAEQGVRLLRTLLSMSGHQPPPALHVAARNPKPAGKER